MPAKQPRRLLITIDRSNDAFHELPEYEVARILKQFALDIESNGLSNRPLRDVNGNTVGRCRLTRL